MDYKTFLPSKSLSSFINCFWTLEVDSEDKPAKQRIVPCSGQPKLDTFS
ncbi:DUF6597 domain-containing transcriptional factor [Motilimonas sp. 1_MG-2023]